MAVRSKSVVRTGLLLMALLLLLPSVSMARVLHVSPGGRDGSDGLQWSTARGSVQSALDSATVGDEVWVAAGVYDKCITLRDGVSLYGGFTGAETARDQRDWRANTTILDGGKRGSVVTSPAGISRATCLDGFTLRNGQAEKGGGVCCLASSPVVTHCTITSNDAVSEGGGVFAGQGAAPLIRGNVVTNNRAQVGGGVYVEGRTPLGLAKPPEAEYPFVAAGRAVGLSITTTGARDDPLTYLWTPRDGGAITGQGALVTFSDALPGVRHIDVSVEDQHGGRVNGTVTLTVVAVAVQTPLPTLTLGQMATLHAQTVPALGDSADFPLKFTWRVTSGPAAGSFDEARNGTAAGSSLAFTPSAGGPGRLSVELRVGSLVVSDSVAVGVGLAALTLAPAILPLAAGETGALALSIPSPAPSGGLAVGLTSSLATTARVPASATIPEGQTQVSVPVTALRRGTSGVVATAGGYTEGRASVQVTTDPTITLSPSPLTVEVGARATCDLRLSVPAPEGDLVVSLTTGTRVSVPASVTVLAGATSATFGVIGLGEGAETLQAAAEGYLSASAPVDVRLGQLAFASSYLPVVTGVPATVNLHLSHAALAGGVQVDLESSDSAVLGVPAAVTIPEGQADVTVELTGLKGGDATLKATAQACRLAEASIRVQAASSLGLCPTVLYVNLHETQTLTVGISSPAPAGGIELAVSASVPDTLVLPATVAIPEGALSARFPVRPVVYREVPVAVKVSSPSLGDATALVTISAPQAAYVTAPDEILVGQWADVEVSIESYAPRGGYNLQVSSADPGVIEVSAAVLAIPQSQNRAKFQIQGRAVGKTTVTVVSAGQILNKTISVVAPAVSVQAEVVAGVGCTATGFVRLDRAVAPSGGFQVSLSSEDPEVASVPALVTIQEGYNYAPFTIRGVAPGTSAITAHPGGLSASSIATVKRATFMLAVSGAVRVGAVSQALSVSTHLLGGSTYAQWDQKLTSASQEVDPTSPMVAQDLLVGLSAGDATVLGVSPVAVILAGQNTSTVHISGGPRLLGPALVTGLRVGATPITAAAAGWASSATAPVEVTERPVSVHPDVVVGAGCISYGYVSTDDGGPALPGGLMIHLSSSDSSIAEAPESVTIPSGSRWVDFPLRGGAPGTAVISVSPGGAVRQGTVTVATPSLVWQPAVPAGGLRLATGDPPYSATLVTSVLGGTSYRRASESGWASKYLLPSQAVASDVVVSLTLSGSGSVQLSASSLSLPAGSASSGSLELTGALAGSSLLTPVVQGWPGTVQLLPIEVAPSVRGQVSLYADVTVGAGCQSQGVVELDSGVAPQAVSVGLVSSNPAVAQVPAAVTIPAGSRYAGFPILGGTPGTARLSATPGGASPNSTVSVVKAALVWSESLSSLSVAVGKRTADLSISSSVSLGSRYSATAGDPRRKLSYWSQPLARAMSVGLSVTPALASLSASSLSIAEGAAQSSTVFLTGVAEGPATLAMSVPDWAGELSQLAVQVTPAYQPKTSVRADVIVGVGFFSYGVVRLDRGSAPAEGVVVQLHSGNPGVAQVPPSVTIPSGAGQAAFKITGVSPGTSAISTDPAGAESSSTVTVKSCALYTSQLPQSVEVGGRASVDCVRCYTPNGSTYLPNNDPWRWDWPPKLDASWPYCGAARDLTVSIAGADPLVVGAAPATVTIPAGDDQSGGFAVTGVGAGSSALVLSASGAETSTTSRKVTVVPLKVSVLADVVVGSHCKVQGAVVLDVGVAPEGGLVVSLQSSDPGVAGVPSSVTIPAGRAYALFDVAGGRPGSASVSASPDGSTPQGSVTCVRPALVVKGVDPSMTLGGTQSGAYAATLVTGGSSWYDPAGYLRRTTAPDWDGFDSLSSYQGYLNKLAYRGQTVSSDLQVSVSVDSSGVLSASPLVTSILSGQSETRMSGDGVDHQDRYLKLTAVALGKSVIAVSAPGWDVGLSPEVVVTAAQAGQGDVGDALGGALVRNRMPEPPTASLFAEQVARAPRPNHVGGIVATITPAGRRRGVTPGTPAHRWQTRQPASGGAAGTSMSPVWLSRLPRGAGRPALAKPTTAGRSGGSQGAAGPRLMAGGRMGLLAALMLGQVPGSEAIALVEGNVIHGNTARGGGGIGLVDARALVRSNILSRNAATGSEGGGGVFVGGDGSGVSLDQNTVVENESATGRGGGVYFAGGTGALSGCIIFRNQDDLWACAATYSCVSSLSDDPGEGNLSLSPHFADVTDPAQPGFFRLAADSPCINAGDPEAQQLSDQADVDGEARLSDGRVDMGADEVSGAFRPDTRILSGPSDGAVVSWLPVIFTWIGSGSGGGPEGLTYSIRVDDEPWRGFSAARSVTMSSFTPGPHTFSVRARDVVGREESEPASTTFSVEYAPFRITDLKVAALGTEATISWVSSKTCTAWLFYGETMSYGLRADAATIDGKQHTVILRGLRPGHTYHYQPCTLDDTGVEYDWQHEFFRANSSPIASAGPDQTVSQDSVGGARVQLDGSGTWDENGDPLTYRWYEGPWLLAGPTATPRATVTLSVGVHTVTLEVQDTAGNRAEDRVLITVTAEPVLDAGTPTTQIASGPTGGAVISAGSATFTWVGTDDVTPTGRIAFSYRLDDQAWSPYASSTSATLVGLSEGGHTFAVRARDLAGHEEQTPATARFVVDLSPPAISLLRVAAGASQAMVSWTTSELARSWVEYWDARDTTIRSSESVGTGPAHGVTLGALKPGHLYELVVYAEDAAGHRSASSETEFRTNAPASADAGPDFAVAQSQPAGATVRLDGTRTTDPDGDPLTYEWCEAGASLAEPTSQSLAAVVLPVGLHAITLRVTDPFGNQATDEVAVTVLSNAQPTASGFSVAVTVGTPASVRLVGSDPDPGTVLQYRVALQPSHGRLSGALPDLVYTPDQGYVGPDTIAYTVNDGAWSSEPARVKILVQRRNEAPRATSRSLTAVAGDPLTIELSGSDPEGQMLLFVVTDGPAHGTLGPLLGNRLSYTADIDAPGTDQFRFTVSDGVTTSEPGTISLTVTPAAPLGRLVVGTGLALPGGTIDVPVWAEGLPELTSTRLVLDLRPPAGCEPLAMQVVAGSRAQGGTLSCGPLSEDARQEVSISLEGRREGELAFLRVTVPQRAAPGAVYPLGVTSGLVCVMGPTGGTREARPSLVSGSVSVMQPGDVSGDGRTDLVDVILMLRIALGLQPGSPGQELSGDLNGDGVLNIVDVLMALRIALHLG